MRAQSLLPFFLAAMLLGCNVSISTTPPEKLPPPTSGTAAQQAEAFEAAKAIVKALDRGAFDQVWEQSSQMFKGSTLKVVFTKLMPATRGNLGQPAPRGAPRIAFSKKVDANVPEGDYSIVEVDTNFSGKTVIERLVLTRESGQWKLAGYFMRTSASSG